MISKFLIQFDKLHTPNEIMFLFKIMCYEVNK
jgi:hypothetical protein